MEPHNSWRPSLAGAGRLTGLRLQDPIYIDYPPEMTHNRLSERHFAHSRTA